MRIAAVGRGNVGGGLARRWLRAGVRGRSGECARARGRDAAVVGGVERRAREVLLPLLRAELGRRFRASEVGTWLEEPCSSPYTRPGVGGARRRVAGGVR